MRAIWSDERKFQIWLEIETIACEAMARLGLIPKEDAAVIRKKGKFEIDEIAEIEKRTNHDVIAFLENVASYVGPAARWIHQGLTSSDILDTTLAVQMTESAANSRRRSGGIAKNNWQTGAPLQKNSNDRAQSRDSRRADHLWIKAGADVR